MITIILEMLVRFQPDSLKYCFNMDNGYVEIIDTTHHRARSSGAVYEHIIVAERKIGRLLKPEEVVHHINKIRHDNRPDNLMYLDLMPIIQGFIMELRFTLIRKG